MPSERQTKGEKHGRKPFDPIKAIRAKCLDCCCGSSNEVKLCTIERCALWAYRFGKNPSLQRERTSAQLEALKNGRVPFQSVDKVGILQK